MEHDTAAWIASVRRKIDEAKTALTSNSRLNETELSALASTLEGVFKACRDMVQS